MKAMKLFKDLILETATPEEFDLALQRLEQEFKDFHKLSEPVKMNLIAGEIRDIRAEKNEKKIANTITSVYGISPETGQKLAEKFEKVTELCNRISGEIASLKFQININAVDREKGKKELEILESKFERAKRAKIALENALFHYNGLIASLKDAILEEIELTELYP